MFHLHHLNKWTLPCLLGCAHFRQPTLVQKGSLNGHDATTSVQRLIDRTVQNATFGRVDGKIEKLVHPTTVLLAFLVHRSGHRAYQIVVATVEDHSGIPALNVGYFSPPCASCSKNHLVI